MSEYAPGTYVKNGRQRTAHTASDAVALVFDGYKPVADEVPVATEAPSEPVVDEAPVVEPKPVVEDETPETSVETAEVADEEPETPVAPKPKPPIKNKN